MKKKKFMRTTSSKNSAVKFPLTIWILKCFEILVKNWKNIQHPKMIIKKRQNLNKIIENSMSNRQENVKEIL